VAPLADTGQRERALPFDEQLHLLTLALTQTRALICLDNVHLLNDEPTTMAVLEHLAVASRAYVLAIGREQTQVPWLDVFPAGGLVPAQARSLIRQLLRPASAAELPVLLPTALVERLAERTGGSPMLIRLAIGQIRAGELDPATAIERLAAQPAITGYLLRTVLTDLSD
jgi:hypothetical protein